MPVSGAWSARSRLGGIPRDVAADGDGVWVSVTSPRATADACAPLEHAAGAAPDVVVALDLPLRTGGRSPTEAMVAAVRRELARRGFRAGDHTVGLLVCDDSTSQSGTFDAATCRANARAYAADARVVAEIGPYNSPCAAQQLPIAAAAPRGPLAVVSPTNTDPLLVRPRPDARGAYVRVIAADDQQAQAAARFLRDRGHRRVFVLDDGDELRPGLRRLLRGAARLAGLEVAGRATWGDARQHGRGDRSARRSRPDAVFVSGLLDNGAGAVVRALRRALPAATIVGSEGLLPVARLFDRAGPAARGVLIATGSPPAAGGAHPYTDPRGAGDRRGPGRHPPLRRHAAVGRARDPREPALRRPRQPPPRPGRDPPRHPPRRQPDERVARRRPRGRDRSVRRCPACGRGRASGASTR